MLQRRVDLANISPNIHHATDTADSEISNAMHCGTWTMNIHLQICKADIAAKSLIYFKTIFYTAFYIDILTYLKNLTPK